jgi:phage tail-like protein
MALVDLPHSIIDKLDFLGLEVLKRFQFAVSIDGDFAPVQYIMGFERVVGIGDSVDVRDVQSGGHSGVFRYPRRARQESVRLVRGMTFNRGLWDWFEEVRNWRKGKPSYARTMSVIMLDHLSPKQTKTERIPFEVWRFDLLDVWPSDWRGPELSAQSEEEASSSP